MFNHCDFLLGQDNSIVVVVPAHLPQEGGITLSISPRDVKFRAGFKEIANIPLTHPDVMARLKDQYEIGVVEYPEGDAFPDCITAIAHVEIRGEQV